MTRSPLPVALLVPAVGLLAALALADHAEADAAVPACDTVTAMSGPALAPKVAQALATQRSQGLTTSSVSALTMQAALVCSW